ncbi:MAG: sulfatase [Planctomycetota bacterium]
MLALWLTLCAVPLQDALPEKRPRPNVLFIAIDDLNDWVGCLGGHPQVKTPHIDRLALRGTLFSNAHCQAPLCNSSRTSLLTGLRPSTTGIYGLAPWFRSVPELKDRITLPELFTRNGTHTMSTGKIFHGGYPPRDQRERECLEWGPDASVGARPEKKLVTTPHGNHPLVDWGTFPHSDEDKGDWIVADWAIEKLKSRPKEPFFLACGFFLPHVPNYATQRWFDLYPEASLKMPTLLEGDREDTPPFSWYLHWSLPEPRLSWLQSEEQWQPLVRAYLATISFVDSQVGRVLGALEESGHAGDTIVVLWSDHGWHLGEKGISGKNSLWEPSTRVPLIFAGPGILEGAVCSRPVELLDLYPTLAALCGLQAPDDLEGHDLKPLLTDPGAEWPYPAITTHNQGNHAIRSERYRYVHYADGTEELYDLEVDPEEWTNLAGREEHRATLEAHRKWLPKPDRPPAPGSRHRVLTYDEKTGVATWEGQPIPQSGR